MANFLSGLGSLFGSANQSTTTTTTQQPDTLGRIIQGAGIGLNFGSALGTIFGGKNNKEAIKRTLAAGRKDAAALLQSAEIQAAAATKNAHLAQFDGAIAAALAQDEADQLRREGRAIIGSQMAAAAASGAQIDVAVMDVVAEQMQDIERVAHRAIYAGELQKRSLDQQADDFLQEAWAVRKTAESTAKSILNESTLQAWRLKQQRRQEVLGAFGTIVESGLRGYSLFRNMTQIDKQSAELAALRAGAGAQDPPYVGVEPLPDPLPEPLNVPGQIL